MSGLDRLLLAGKSVNFTGKTLDLTRLDYRLVVASRSGRRIQELSELVQEVRWRTRLSGSPGQLTFDLVKEAPASYGEGDRVTFILNGRTVFQGYVFHKDKNERGEIATCCYDQIRYLKVRQSYNFSQMSAGAIVKKIASDLGLKWGQIVDTGYKLPSLIVDDKECLDVITAVLDATYQVTDKQYVFYDDGGCLNLQPLAALKSRYILGEESFTAGYRYTTSIDDGVYNYVKLVQPAAADGQARFFSAKSAANIGLWGLLQLYQKVDETLTPAQVQELARAKLDVVNRKKRLVRLSCLGLPELRAGSTVAASIPNLGDIHLAQALLVEEACHRFTPTAHTMELTCSINYAPDDLYSVQTATGQEFAKGYSRRKSAAAAAASSGSAGSSGSSASSASGSAGGRYRPPFHGRYRISTPYGKRGKAWSCGWHSGTDYVGISSDRVYAIGSGAVTFVGKNGAYGNCVIIKHPDGYLSLYAHLASINVTRGQSVTDQTNIGLQGATGNASGVHLHLEIHKGGYKYPSKYDPAHFV